MSHAAEHYLPATSDYSVEETRGVYRKVILRLLPYLVLAYAINTIDRLNVSFAKLRMAEDIGLTDAAYGLGAGIFYLGYILFEVPSNIYLQRTGARATLTRIMVLWGMVTVATAFVTTADQLIVARFLLGVAEAGFFPGVILYLTYWFPPALRARITAVFLMAAMVAGIISGPLAGTIMSHFHGWLGLRDWQVLFVLEGVPAMLLGLFGWFWLVDKPDDARWLTVQEKHMLAACLAHGRPADTPNASLVQVLRNPQVYIAGLVFFCIYSGSNTVSYWMPTLIRGFGVQDLKSIGLLASVPYMGALIGMYLLARSSDKRLERRWHVSLTLMLSATCFFLLGPVQDHLVLSVVFMSIGAAAALSALSLFWSIPPALLSPSAAAVGIAVISCIGGLAGVISQIVVGAIKTATGDLYLAFDVIAGVLVVGAVVLLVAIPASQLKERVKA